MRADVDFEFFDRSRVLAFLGSLAVALEDMPVHFGNSSLESVGPPVGVGLLRAALSVVTASTSSVSTSLPPVASPWVRGGRCGAGGRPRADERSCSVGGRVTHVNLRELP